MSLIEVKKKIDGVGNTRKITKAMQLVAASKMKLFQKRAVSAREYVVDLVSIIEKNLTEDVRTSYTESRKEGKTVFVLYTSDKGLCGALNTKLINNLFRSEKWLNTPEDQRVLITIGRKSQGYARANKIKIDKKFEGVSEKLNTVETIEVVDGIIAYWHSKEAKEIIFVAPHYKNSFTFYPVMKTFLPFSEESVASVVGPSLEDGEEYQSVKSGNASMIYSPEQEETLKNLFLQAIQAMFVQSFLELKAAEYSNRMIAMQNATDSADKIMMELRRQYNKARQQAITQEIAELIGASMAFDD